MHAITVSNFGPPSVLQEAEVPTPEPTPGQVLVEVTGAGVGPWDVKMRDGRLGPQPFPYIPGAELSGLVARVGEGAAGFASGAPVFGSAGFQGAYAEYVAVDVRQLADAPTSVDLETAGAAPVAGTTALEGIDDHLRLQPGERVLVAGAAGGVGHVVVQVAKVRGAEVVATASPTNHEFLASIGADLVLDYHDDWVGEAAGVDAAFDCVGGPTWEQCVRAVRPGGRAVTIVRPERLEHRSDVVATTFSATVTAARLAEVAQLLDSGRVVITIAARLALADAARAHALIETGHTRGKLVLVPG